MLCGMYTQLLAPANCVSSGFTGCCRFRQTNECKAPAGNCYCHENCYKEGNCCDDIYAINCKLWPNSKRVVIFLKWRVDVKKTYFMTEYRDAISTSLFY